MTQLPEGHYTACVIPMSFDGGTSCIQFGESPKKATPQVTVKLGILEGDEQGQSVYWTGYLTDKTVTRTVISLRALGFTGTDFRGFLNQQPSTSVDIEIVHEEYDGKTRAKVKWINPLKSQLDGSGIDALSEQFKDVLSGNGLEEDAPRPPGDDQEDQINF